VTQGGCNLKLILEWAWDRVVDIKNQLDQLCKKNTSSWPTSCYFICKCTYLYLYRFCTLFRPQNTVVMRYYMYYCLKKIWIWSFEVLSGRRHRWWLLAWSIDQFTYRLKARWNTQPSMIHLHMWPCLKLGILCKRFTLIGYPVMLQDLKVHL